MGLWFVASSSPEELERFQAKWDAGSREENTSKQLMCRSSRDAEKAFEYRGIGPQGGTRRVMDDRTALQYHNAVGQPQNLLRILLDDDRGEPLGRLIEQQHFWIEGQRAPDRQHLLLAAGELVAEMGAALFQPRKHLVDFFNGPRARLRHRGHVLFHRQRAKDIALLRHPADAGPRPLVRPHPGDILPAEGDGSSEAARDPDNRIDQRGLAGAVAPQ